MATRQEKIKVKFNHPYPCCHCGKNNLVFKSLWEYGRCSACKKEANLAYYFLASTEKKFGDGNMNTKSIKLNFDPWIDRGDGQNMLADIAEGKKRQTIRDYPVEAGTTLHLWANRTTSADFNPCTYDYASHHSL